MATNDFIGFASSGNANVMSQADYAAAAEQGAGVQPGMASSKFANKVWRQGANMAAAIGEFITSQGYDARDNGDLNTLKNNVSNAINFKVNNIVSNYVTGTLNASSIIDTPDASQVYRINNIGFYILNCKLNNGSLVGYSSYLLHTSSIKPKINTIGLLTGQSTPFSGVFLSITTSGEINLRTTAGTLPAANTYYYGVIIFPI